MPRTPKQTFAQKRAQHRGTIYAFCSGRICGYKYGYSDWIPGIEHDRLQKQFGKVTKGMMNAWKRGFNTYLKNAIQAQERSAAK